MAHRQAAPVTLSPSEWTSLHEAFHQVRAWLGYDQPTERDLTRGLRNGSLVGAIREFQRVRDRTGAIVATETVTVCSTSFWNDYKVVASRMYGGATVDPLLDPGTYVFIRRDGLDKHYPCGLPSVDKSTASNTMQPPRRRRGPVVTHDWFSICAEIARRCIDPKTGHVRVPANQSKLVGDVLQWVADQDKDQPATSEMSEAVRRVCAAMQAVQK
jgi:hypothetical protein